MNIFSVLNQITLFCWLVLPKQAAELDTLFFIPLFLEVEKVKSFVLLLLIHENTKHLLSFCIPGTMNQRESVSHFIITNW